MKTLVVSGDRTLKEIKSDFNRHFPHLKIEFFSIKHINGEASPRMAIYDENILLSSISKHKTDGELCIDGHLKTASFEQSFKAFFGVSIQVYRKSGNIWLQTITTDSWTLDEQERKGRQMAS